MLRVYRTISVLLGDLQLKGVEFIGNNDEKLIKMSPPEAHKLKRVRHVLKDKPRSAGKFRRQSCLEKLGGGLDMNMVRRIQVNPNTLSPPGVGIINKMTGATADINQVLAVKPF